MVSIGDSEGVPQHGQSVNVMNGIDYSSFISLGTMNLTPLINVFSQSIGMILSKTIFSCCHGNAYLIANRSGCTIL